MMSRRQNRAIRLAHLRKRHLTATETALDTVGKHNRRISPKIVRNRLLESGLHARCPNVRPPMTQARRLCLMAWLTTHAPMQAISIEAVETGPFYGQVSRHSFSPGWSTSYIPTSRGTLRERDRFGVVPLWPGEALRTG